MLGTDRKVGTLTTSLPTRCGGGWEGGQNDFLDFLLLGLVIENMFKPEIYILKPSYSYSAHFSGFLDSFAWGGGGGHHFPLSAAPFGKDTMTDKETFICSGYNRLIKHV
jgi:hypothetical protein